MTSPPLGASGAQVKLSAAATKQGNSVGRRSFLGQKCSPSRPLTPEFGLLGALRMRGSSFAEQHDSRSRPRPKWAPSAPHARQLRKLARSSVAEIQSPPHG